MKWTPQNTMNSASGMLRDVLGELVRIAGVVGELDHFVALIVMPENDEATAERRLRRGNPRVHFLVGQTDIPLRQRLPLGDVLFFVFGQDGKERGHLL